jgi:DnaJ like chaperone protein
MGWLGKVVGGTIGFALGGPLGAIAGTAFGHMFDADGEQYYSDERPSLSSDERAQMTFFVASFSMLAKLAKADNRVSDEEIRTVENFMAHDLNLNTESRNFAINIFRAALDSPETFQDFARQFHDQFRYQPRLLEMMIDILMRVSMADGTISEIENSLIRDAVRIFNFSEDAYSKLTLSHVQDVEKYYAILGSTRDDSDQEIKSRYRKLVQEYHPDKIASKGLPEEFNKFAHDKFREIQEAYDVVKKERGMS